MTPAAKTLAVSLQRLIPAAPAEVYDAWMDPGQPCNPWHHCKKAILNAKPGGLFYLLGRHGAGVPHFGRFIRLSRGRQVKHTWMSPFTRGLETEVTVGFKKQAGGTLMTLRHAGLPNDAFGRSHQEGWGYFFGLVGRRFPPNTDGSLKG
jgi:uncharacterized protein YndB with AHSA1/START domain